MKEISLVALGGALGSVLRYLVYGWTFAAAERASDSSFPWGTLAVNLIGCFFIGVLWECFDRDAISSSARLLLMTGLLGGFTTFSAYSMDTVILLRDGKMGAAAINVSASTLGGLLLAAAGIFAARFIFGGAK